MKLFIILAIRQTSRVLRGKPVVRPAAPTGQGYAPARSLCERHLPNVWVFQTFRIIIRFSLKIDDFTILTIFTVNKIYYYLFFPFIGWIALSAQSWFSKGSTTEKICIAKTWYTVHINKHMNKVIKQEIYKYTMVKVNKTRQYKTWL